MVSGKEKGKMERSTIVAELKELEEHDIQTIPDEIWRSIIDGNYLDLMKTIIQDYHFDIRINNSEPLFYCCVSDDDGGFGSRNIFEMLKLLIGDGVYKDYLFVLLEKYQDLFDNVISYGSLDMVKYLLELKINIYAHDGAAFKTGRRDLCQYIEVLINYGIDIGHANSHLLVMAVRKNNVEAINLAIEYIPPNLLDKPFVTAIEGGEMEIAKLFLSRGANVSCCNNMALRRAMECRKVNMIQWLLDCGADISCFRDCDFGFKNYREVFRLLVSKGVDPSDIVYLLIGD